MPRTHTTPNVSSPGGHRHRRLLCAASVLLLSVVGVVQHGVPRASAALVDWFDGPIFSGPDGRYLGHPQTLIQIAGGQNATDLCNFEDESLAAYDAQRGVPWTDDERDRMLSWGRNDARGILWANLLAAVAKPAAERSTNEQAAVAWLTNRTRALRVAQAQASLDEYNAWKADPCNYTPPAPYTYSPTGCNANSLTVLFSGPPSPPSYEDFVHYGAMKVLGSIYNADGAMAAVQATRTMMAALALGGLTIGVAGIAAAAIQAGVTLGSILPYAGAYGAASLAAGSAAAIVGIALGVILCVVIAVVRGIQVTEQAQIPTQLAADITRANATTPDVVTMAGNTNDVGVLFAAFLDGTMPAWNNPSFQPAAPSAPSADAPGFLITGGGSDKPHYSQTLVVSDGQGTMYRAWLDHGWWVLDPDGDDPPFMSLTLEYFSSDNRVLTARNQGDSFLVQDPAKLATDSGCVDTGCATTTSLDYYTTPDGNPPIVPAHAQLVGAPLTITSTPHLDATYDSGDAVHLAATASDTPLGGNLTYRWTISRPSAIDPTTPVSTTLFGPDVDATLLGGGTYTVTLDVTDELGQSASWSTTTTVTSQPQAITITQQYTNEFGFLRNGYWPEGDFTQAGTPGKLVLANPDGVNTQFTIDWNNDAHWDQTVTGSTVTLDQPDWMIDDGQYLVHIAALSDDGHASIDNYEVIVTDVAPTVTDVQVDDGGTWVTPSRSSAATPMFTEGDTVHARFRFSDPGLDDNGTAKLVWSDGTVQTLTGLTPGQFYEASHRYVDRNGNDYGLRIWVTDTDGVTSTFEGDAYFAVAESPATISDLTTTLDADGNLELRAGYGDVVNDVDNYTVDWGDGTATATGTLPMMLPPDADSELSVFSFDQLAASHHYSGLGTFTITVTVGDGSYGTATATREVTVANHRPSITDLVDLSSLEGRIGRIAVTAYDPDTPYSMGSLHATIDWGDGTTGAGGFDPTTNSIVATHQFAATGDYPVSITVVDADGGESEPLVGTLVVTEGSPAHLELAPSTDVGVARVGTTGSGSTVTVTNDGGNIATISDMDVSGSDAGTFAVADNACAGARLLPGGSCTLRVTFTPTAEGAASATLSVTGDSGGESAATALTGTGVTLLLDTTTPNGSVDFGTLAVGSNSQHLIGIANTADYALNLDGVGLGAFVADALIRHAAALPISIASLDGFSIDSTTCPTTLEAGESCSIDVSFAPPGNGAHQADLTVTGDLDARVHLQGTGTGGTTTTTTTPGTTTSTTTMPATTTSTTTTTPATTTSTTTTVPGATTTTSTTMPGATTTTSTTMPGATTTTSTTMPGATTTSAPGRSTTSSASTSNPSVGATSESGNGPSNDVAAGSINRETSPTDPNAAGESPGLPDTGSRTLVWAWSGFALLAAGIVVLGTRRRLSRD